MSSRLSLILFLFYSYSILILFLVKHQKREQTLAPRMRCSNEKASALEARIKVFEGEEVGVMEPEWFEAL